MQVAVANVAGPGKAQIITAAGPGGEPQVRVFNPEGIAMSAFNAYNRTFGGGVYVAGADLDGDGRAEIVTGAGPGGAPHVRAFDGFGGALPTSFYAYAPSFPGGVRVAAGDIDGDGKAEIITGAGPGGAPHVRAFDAAGVPGSTSFYAYTPNFGGGVFVAVAHS